MDNEFGQCFVEEFKRVGEARYMLNELKFHELFDNLSKHNPWWDSEHEIEGDKLEDIRMQLSFIHSRFIDVLDKLRKPEYE